MAAHVCRIGTGPLALVALAAALLAGCSAEPVSGSAEGGTGQPAAGAPEAVNLDTLPSLNETYSKEIVEINGEQYPHSVTAVVCGGNDSTWEFNLGRDHGTLRATLGLADDSPAETRVRFEVFGDGQRLLVQEMGLGTDFALDVPVRDVLRLKLVSTNLSERGCGKAAWGEAQLRPSAP